MTKSAVALVAILVSLIPSAEATAATVPIVVWHCYSGLEKVALEQVGARYAKVNPGIEVRLVQMSFDTLISEVSASDGRRIGPDLLIFGHDRIGDWARRKIIEPIAPWMTDAIARRFPRVALGALTHEGALYGLPTALKCVALIYSKKQIQSPPRTTAALVETAKKLTAPEENRYGLAYEILQPYHNAAWLFGFGGGLFDRAGKPILDCAGNVRALGFLASLYRDPGLMPREISGTNVSALFERNQAAMVVSGSWFLGELGRGVLFDVAPLPVVPGQRNRSTPFLTVEGILLGCRSAHKKEAFAVMKYFTGEKAAIIMARKGRQPVANLLAYADPVVRKNRYIQLFRQEAERAVLTPNTPEMGAVWPALEKALRKVLIEAADPAGALAEAQASVVAAVRALGRGAGAEGQRK